MATVEYAALVLLVSTVLVVGGAVADARAIPVAVGAQLRKALCLVAGGDCFARGGPRPCVVGSRSQLTEHRVAAGVVRLRDGRTVLLERLSDGSFRVSLALASGGGAGVQLGVEIAGRGVDVDAQAGGDLGHRRVFVAPDAAAARRLVERLGREAPPAGGALPGIARFLLGRGRDDDAEHTPAATSPDGVEVERVVSVTSRGEAQAALTALDLGPRAGLLRTLRGSVRLDRRTGDRTLGLDLGGEASATLGAAIGQATAGVAVAPAGVELVLDARRRPRELVVRGATRLHGAVRLPSGGLAGGDVRQIEARLDVTDPVVRALTDRVLDGDLGAVRALAAHVATQARIDVRHFAMTRDEDTSGGTVLGFGAERFELVETTRLVAASGREPGLGWTPRLDCASAAAA